MKKTELKDEIVTLKDVTARLSADNKTGLYQNDDIIIIDSLSQLSIISNVMVDFFVIVICYKGQIILDADGRTFTITKGSSFVSSCYSHINKALASVDFKGTACCISHSFINRVLLDNKELWTRYEYLVTHPLLKIDNEHKEVFNHFFRMINKLTAFSSQPYYHMSIESLTRCGLYFLLGTFTKAEQNKGNIVTGDDLFSRFIRLVKIDQGCHREIDYYASQLYVTGKHLSYVCTQKCNKTAKQIITEQAIDRLRYLLLETSIPIKQIAADMLFANLSFLGRYVVKHFGAAPSVLRR